MFVNNINVAISFTSVLTGGVGGTMGLVIILQSMMIVVLLIQRYTRFKRFVQGLDWICVYTNHVFSTVLICQLTMNMALCPLSITMINW